MNKLYLILIRIFIVTIITVVSTNTYARAGGYDDSEPQKAARNYNPGVIPPHAKIQGKTYGDWGAKWWNWALSVPYAKSPIVDATGKFGAQNQQGPVWFLAGTFGIPAERTITIPAGKFIFFPLVNTENDWPCPDPNFKPASGQSMEDFLTVGAVAQIDPWAGPNHTLSASVDGAELTHLLNYRGTSKLTTLIANNDPTNVANIDSCITGTKQDMVSDGYWIMLAPLKPGKHEIKFSAIAPLSPPLPFDLDVTYHVTISKGEQETER
jgi:hypothetical protein